jgi:DNA replication protein DnaC
MIQLNSLGQEAASCEDCGAEFTRLFLVGFAGFCTRRCAVCCGLWEAREEAARTGRQVARIVDSEPELTRKFGFPPRYLECSFANFDPGTPNKAATLAAARKWVAAIKASPSGAGNRLLIGSVGAGKTHLAVAIGRAVAEAGIAVKFGKLASLMAEVKAGALDDTSDGEARVIAQLSKVPLLIIDEVFPQAVSEKMWPRLFEILDNRWDNMKPTLMTTNLSREGLAQFLTERLVSRLTGPETVLVCDGVDFRKHADAK